MMIDTMLTSTIKVMHLISVLDVNYCWGVELRMVHLYAYHRFSYTDPANFSFKPIYFIITASYLL